MPSGSAACRRAASTSRASHQQRLRHARTRWLDWPVNDALTLSAGAGRLRWGVQASGSDADGARYRRRSQSSGSNAGDAKLAASVNGSF
jgi:hypothetical protein